MLIPDRETAVDVRLVPQVVRDDRVDVHQGNGGVLLRDLLGSRTGLERTDDRVERHPRAGNPHDAAGVGMRKGPRAGGLCSSSTGYGALAVRQSSA